MGASSFVVSRRAFQGLTEAAAGDCALFLLPLTKQGQRKDKKNENDRPRIREGDIRRISLLWRRVFRQDGGGVVCVVCVS